MTKELKLSQDTGFLRVGAAVPELRVGDIDFNIAGIIDLVRKASGEGVQVVFFPEMAVTAYTIGDLVQHGALLNKALDGVCTLREETASLPLLIVVGMPLVFEQKIYNCGVVLCGGRVLGVVPKTSLPNYKEFYENRWFAPSVYTGTDTIEIGGQAAPFGTDILFRLKGIPSAVIGVEICEDLWVPLSPHEFQALGGATVLLNLSASNEVLGKADWRRTMVASESGRCNAAYCYVSSGFGESSNDVVWGGHALIAENGTILRESPRLSRQPHLLIADIDLERLAFDRRNGTTFQSATQLVRQMRSVEAEVGDPAVPPLERDIDPHPFVPGDPAGRAERCREIFSMQVAALAQKLSGARLSRLVLGISGGLDSTLALLVAVKTMDFMSLPRSNVHAFTLPGFGTTGRTKSNATRLCQALGVSFAEVDIKATCSSHLADLGHNGDTDLVYENVQARYRTEFLFNKANALGAINLGTGDLTEIALGWSTFSGDQLSHYDVNASVPKTLVRYLVRWVADEDLVDSPAQGVLYDILETPISPELLPADHNGDIVQKSEEVIGPVELADFYLYPFIRFGMPPGRILFLAEEARSRGLFDKPYSLDELYRWLKSFLERFFANQFKRTCMPEGPKVGSVSLSPRGDWRMPSEAKAKLWLEDLDAMYARLKE